MSYRVEITCRNDGIERETLRRFLSGIGELTTDSASLFSFTLELPDGSNCFMVLQRIHRELFDRFAEDRVLQVWLAVEDVEGYGITVGSASNSDDLIGLAELAEWLGVSKQVAHGLTGKPEAPAPVVRLTAGPVWRRDSWQSIRDQRQSPSSD